MPREKMISYDKKFWDRYADTNEARYDAEFAGRVAYTASELGCTSVLEVGCGTCIDLRLLPQGVASCGLDPNYAALRLAKTGMPHVHLARGMITDMPFADSSIDMVFTHRLLNYLLDEDVICRGMKEMYRVARKYIMSCEWSSQKEDMIDDRCKMRNMSDRWTKMGASVVGDAQIHAAATATAKKDEAAAVTNTRLTLVHITKTAL